MLAWFLSAVQRYSELMHLYFLCQMLEWIGLDKTVSWLGVPVELYSQSVPISGCLATIVILKYFRLMRLLCNMDFFIPKDDDAFHNLKLQSGIDTCGQS